MKRILSLICGVVALATLAAPASAQSWPTQRVTIVVPFGAGSVTDILARIFAEEMGKHWGQQVIVENRPGLCRIGRRRQVHAGRLHLDGHVERPHASRAWSPRMRRSIRSKDFAGITRLGSAPLFLITPPDFSAKTLKDIIELAKKEPGKLNFSSPGLASTTFIAGALFRKAAGINIVHVPFRSAPMR